MDLIVRVVVRLAACRSARRGGRGNGSPHLFYWNLASRPANKQGRGTENAPGGGAEGPGDIENNRHLKTHKERDTGGAKQGHRKLMT